MLILDQLDLCHDDKRDAYFFLESETPFRYIARRFDSKIRVAHGKAEQWLSGLARSFEEPTMEDSQDSKDGIVRDSSHGVYSKLWQWADVDGGQLTFEERASEVMDHMGK